MSDDKKYTVPVSNKNVSIPIMLFAGIASILLFGNDDPQLLETVRKGINDKFDSMHKRNLYSQYRDKNLTAAQREEARIAYLHEIGIEPGHDFWWPADYEANHYE